jgi:hypothetical protein
MPNTSKLEGQAVVVPKTPETQTRTQPDPQTQTDGHQEDATVIDTEKSKAGAPGSLVSVPSEELLGSKSEEKDKLGGDTKGDAADTADGALSALLDLPPPPAFDVVVDGLTVGVPHHRTARLMA